MALVETSGELHELRQRLTAARADGQPWEQAWHEAMAALLAPLGEWHATQLHVVLAGTEQTWRRAYERTASTRLDYCARRLEEFALDADAELTYTGPRP